MFWANEECLHPKNSHLFDSRPATLIRSTKLCKIASDSTHDQGQTWKTHTVGGIVIQKHISSNDPVDVCPFDVEEVAGVPFRVTGLDVAARWVVDTVGVDHLPINIRLANAWNVALASDDPEYLKLLTLEGINLPDGAPVTWFMNLQRRSKSRIAAERVRGPSIFRKVMRLSLESGTRHFLLGGSPETLDSLVNVLNQELPGVNIVGSYSPPFAPVTEEYISGCAEQIRGTKPDLVWVGLGTPKQDYVGTALAKALGIATLNVGAAFDFTAGTQREAPNWVQHSGFEWLYRLISEPRRLWRRYAYGNFRFLYVATKSMLHPTSLSRKNS